MDNSGRIILDISSDEDMGWSERGFSFNGGFGCGRDDDCWIKEVLSEVEKNEDDYDEVLVVGEVIANPKQMRPKCIDNEEDDDCVVLDGDPERPVAIDNDGGNDSDDLYLISEKGQVACRDYPHPRHLCVKFPFNSTPHERHCDQCHCYVCDSVAPCVYWGNGISSIDHCHATEKDKFWKAQRSGAKASHNVQPLVSNVGLTPMNQVPSLPSNPSMHHLEPANQPCSITSSGTPHGVMPVRTQESGCNPSNKFQPHLVSRHLRRQNVGHAGTEFIPHHLPYRRPGIFGGTLTPNKYRNSSSRNNCGYQFSVNQSRGSRWQETRERGNPTSSTYQCTETNFGRVAANSLPNSSTWSPRDNGIGNYAHSQPQPQVYSQKHSSSVNTNPAAPPSRISSQTCIDSNLGNLMPTIPGVATQQMWGNRLANQMSLEAQAASQPHFYQNIVPTQQPLTSLGNINSENPVNFYGETPINQNSEPLPIECAQFQNSVAGEDPAISTNLQWSPIPDVHQMDSLVNILQFEDVDIPLSPLYLSESAPMDGGFFFDS